MCSIFGKTFLIKLIGDSCTSCHESRDFTSLLSYLSLPNKCTVLPCANLYLVTFNTVPEVVFGTLMIINVCANVYTVHVK